MSPTPQTGRILVWIDLSLVDESQKLSEGIHFNPDLWPGNLDKTENVEASICSLAESSWEGLNFLRQEKSGDADYVTRRFNPKHMPVLKKAAQSFYCIKPDLNYCYLSGKAKGVLKAIEIVLAQREEEDKEKNKTGSEQRPEKSL